MSDYDMVLAVMAALIQDFMEEGEEILAVALNVIKEVTGKDLKEKERFAIVYQKVREQLQNTATNHENSLEQRLVIFYDSVVCYSFAIIELIV